MANYIDGFVLPIPKDKLEEYRQVSKQVAEIWKEYGALAYFEYVGDDLALEGTRSFPEITEMKQSEVIIFGWVVFPSKAIRDSANKKVPLDSRMNALVAPITEPGHLIFDTSRMVYGGFSQLVPVE